MQLNFCLSLSSQRHTARLSGSEVRIWYPFHARSGEIMQVVAQSTLGRTGPSDVALPLNRATRHLLGFMRRWRTSPGEATRPPALPAPQPVQEPRERELHEQIKAAPSSNRQFHTSDLCRVIGQAACDARIAAVIRQFGCPRFRATLAVHGRAVLAGEISR